MARPPSHDGDFTEFVQASWPGLYRTAYLLVGDRGLAEDLAQIFRDRDSAEGIAPNPLERL